MKAGVHPAYHETKFKCVCGNIIVTRSSMDTKPAADGYHHIEICAECHPFYTGKQKLMDKAGRVERFNRRYGRKTATTTEAKPEAKAEPESESESASS